MSPVGTRVEWKDSPPPRSAPTDTGVWFVTGLTEKGPVGYQRITSLNQFVSKYGSRQTWSLLYDSVETFFREGGSVAYVSRVLGPAPVTAFVDLSDGTNPTLRISASSPGEWGNALNVEVVAGTAGGTFVLVISHDTLGELYRSPDLADKTAAISWASTTADVRASDLAGTGDPVVAAAASLATGTDDRVNAVEANWTAALDYFTNDLGPGQVSAPGRTTTEAHTALLNHAALKNRVAVLDAPDASAVATLTAAAAAQRTMTNARFGAMFGPWAIIPGILPGTTRTVPYSAVQAGLIARSDAVNTPNVPAAGINGQSRYALGVKYVYTDSERDTLNEAGVNIAREIYGGIRTYGWRTLVDPVSAPTWLQFGNARLAMHVASMGDSVLENYVLAEIDGRGHKLSQLYGELVGVVMPLWQAGSLYGATPEEAFIVETGDSVNTPETLAAGELHATIGMRMSPHAELVILELAKVPITEEIA